MTAGNKLSRIIAVFLCAVLAIGTILFFVPRENVSADGSVSVHGVWVSGDFGGFHLKVSGYSKGNNVDVTLRINGTAYASFNGKAVQVLSDGSSKIKLRVKGWNGDDGSPNNSDYYVQLSGTPLPSPLKVTVEKTKISRTPTPKPTQSTTKKTNPTSGTTKSTGSTQSTTTEHKKTNKKKSTSNKKSSSDKKAAAQKNNGSKKKKTVKSSQTSITTETTDNKIMLAAAGRGEETTTNPSDPTEEDNGPADAVLSHNNLDKNQRSFAWLWVVLLAIIAGLSFLRVRKLRNDGKHGKDLLLDFIPGVGDLVYAYAGSSKKYAPIASDAQHGYSYNPAVGKKEIKQIDEEAAKEEQSPFKPAASHGPIKRPKEFSVNHAAAVAAEKSSDETASAAASASPVLSAGIAPKSERKAGSPFKKLEGATRPDAVDPNAVFKTEVSHTTDDIMTSAFKPDSSSHTTEKIVTSAFKPAGGSHTSEKIVTSAVKQSSKFTPQGGASARKTVSAADSESIRLARERAEAAREQQAMRAAMRTGKSVAEIKGEAKPVQSGPVNRPSAFGTNRPAASTSNAKPEFNPTVVPARTKAATSNSNQLGTMLSGRSNNAAARTPVWATPSASINPFQKSSDAKEEVKEQVSDTSVQEEAPVQTSYADQAVSHKSAFFSRAASKEGREDTVYSTSAYGSILPPTAALAEDKHVKDTRYKQSKGSLLEGQKPAIANPNQHVAPTATQPVFGFKPVDPQ